MGHLSLSRFQTDFAALLLQDASEVHPALARLAAQPAFAIYRNGVMKSAVDAVQANYPAVSRLVGNAWFRAAASEYVRRSPPASPMLVEYGAGFAEFLADFEPAAALPYLAPVAQLERMWTEAHIAASTLAFDGAALAAIPPQMLAQTVLEPHPAARWAWFDTLPVYTLWERNRSTDDEDAGIEWIGEGALLTRPSSVVRWCAVDRASCAFLDACRTGKALGDAAQAALDADAEADLSRLMQTLILAGAFRPPIAANPFDGDER